MERASVNSRAKPRVLKAPTVRRAEIVDSAQRLFLSRGYERTTVNDVIGATGLSKGALYHHFRSKEELLEAIAERFARESLSYVATVQADASLNALRRLNTLLAMGREWKEEHLPQLRAMFTTILKPENALLHHRIVNAVFSVMAPILAAIIEQGTREGVFDVADARVAAETLLWLSNSRQKVLVEAMAASASGDVDVAAALIYRRIKAEEEIVGRILGLKDDRVELVGSLEYVRKLIVAWHRSA